jgi:hypothetical protein
MQKKMNGGKQDKLIDFFRENPIFGTRRGTICGMTYNAYISIVQKQEAT